MATPAIDPATNTASRKPLDVTIEEDIHDLFVHVVATPNASGEPAKLEIAEALHVLVSINPCEQHEEQTNHAYHHKGGQFRSKYFSSRRGGLIEVDVSGESNNCEIEVTDKDGNTKVIMPALSQETKNQLFQSAVLKLFNAPYISEVGKMTLAVVLVALGEHEELDRFEDAFNKHRTLFSKLSKVYEMAHLDALLGEGEDASARFAVDKALKIIGKEEWETAEIAKEQDAMMREG